MIRAGWAIAAAIAGALVGYGIGRAGAETREFQHLMQINGDILEWRKKQRV